LSHIVIIVIIIITILSRCHCILFRFVLLYYRHCCNQYIGVSNRNVAFVVSLVFIPRLLQSISPFILVIFIIIVVLLLSLTRVLVLIHCRGRLPMVGT
jgi:hypothetical protein